MASFPLKNAQWGIRETAAKPKMVLPPSEQHCLGVGVRALTAF